jgi:beta-lactamase class D
MRVRTALLLILSTILNMGAASAATSCTAIADAASGKVLKQEGPCTERATPASTFKIAISLMGYDAGLLIDEHTPALPFREGYPDALPAWRTTTDPTSWIKNSVVWYSQQVTQGLGEHDFRRYVTEFGYGNGDLSGDSGQHNGLTRAWLSSSLKISPLEQLAFLSALVTRKYPVSAHAYEMTSRLTALTKLFNGWDIHGKTGTGSAVRPDGSYDSGRPVGWFVGWATKGSRTVVFARLIQDETRETTSAGIRARDALLAELPTLLDAL